MESHFLILLKSGVKTQPSNKPQAAKQAALNTAYRVSVYCFRVSELLNPKSLQVQEYIVS